MVSRYENIVLDIVCRLVAPLIMLFALYVVFHGHYSPGGGFQGGAILAAGAMLLRLTLGKERTGVRFPPRLALVLGAVGLTIFGGTGMATIIGGGNYLDYSFLPIPAVDGPYLRYLGILTVEVGIAVGVFGMLLAIFDNLVED